jgi:hypothetical protein
VVSYKKRRTPAASTLFFFLLEFRYEVGGLVEKGAPPLLPHFFHRHPILSLQQLDRVQGSREEAAYRVASVFVLLY